MYALCRTIRQPNCFSLPESDQACPPEIITAGLINGFLPSWKDTPGGSWDPRLAIQPPPPPTTCMQL